MQVLFDVDTQKDFMERGRPMCIMPASEEIRPRMAALNSYALIHNIPVIGSLDKHYGTREFSDMETELDINGGAYPEHCMAHTEGQLKIPETNFGRIIKSIENSEEIPNKSEFCVQPGDIGVYFEKQSPNVFSNQGLDILLREWKVTEALVYGVATDICVLKAVEGLLARNIKCRVIEDCVAGTGKESCKQAIKTMLYRGASTTTSNLVLAGMV